MVCLVCDEVTQKVHNVGGEILPGCGWNRSTASDRKLDQVNHSAATSRECAQQLRWLYGSPVDGFRNYDAVTRTNHLDPHAASIVKVSGDGADSATRRAGNGHGPQLWWQVLDEIHRHAIVCLPRVDQRLAVCKFLCHAMTSLKTVRNCFICSPVPIVTRRKFGRAGKRRPTSTPRVRIASMTGLTSRRRSIIMKFACDGM